MKLSILSPERKLVEGITVAEVTLPSSEGQIQILDGHIPMVGTLDTGIFHYRALDGQVAYGVLSSGFFEVKNGEIMVMSETLELKNEIDIDRARRAQQAAEQALKDATLDPHHFKMYQLKLQRSLIRQQLASQSHPQ